MWESMTKIVGSLPAKWKYAGLSVMVGFLLGGGTAEGVGIYTQVEDNSAFIGEVDGKVMGLEDEVDEINMKLDMVLCILVLEDDLSPLTCASGGAE